VLIDRPHFAPHRAWLIFVAVATIAAAAWYASVGFVNGLLPGGSSAPGLSLGIVGGLLIVFEFALWPRKKVRVWRIGRAQTWMRAHIWLGLLTVPFIILHTGFRTGGPLPTVLLLLFAVVIVSGVYGLWMQQVIPRTMLEQIRSETIHTQFDRVARQLANESEAIVRSVSAGSETTSARRAAAVEVASVAEAQESAGGVFRPWQVKTLERQIAVKLLPNGDDLADFYRSELQPFLLHGSADSRLANTGQANQLFEALRRRFGAPGESVINAFEDLARERRDLDVQLRLHRRLHAWMAIHLAMSVALVILMFVHIYTALRYW
jgi:hypothetical protein